MGVLEMSLDFPSMPVAGATHTEAGLTWRWVPPRWIATTSPPPELLPPQVLVVTASQVLPSGFTGNVLVQAAAALTLTLPPIPIAGQAVTIKDAVGNAGSYPITVNGNSVTIEGTATLVINFNYGWLSLVYGGTQWLQA
jgi:hypothetical protein